MKKIYLLLGSSLLCMAAATQTNHSGLLNGTTGMNTIVVPISNGGPKLIPVKIEAENWSNMYGVQTEATTDDGGGWNVGWIDYTDFIEYHIDVPTAGKYELHLRLATTNNNAEFTITKDGGLLSKVHVPITGSYQNWVTDIVTLNLEQGQQTLRLTSIGGGCWNVNWLEFKYPPAPVYTLIPAKIEAEEWYEMNGVRTEPTTDADGGLNVGWIDYADWMDYNINVPDAGKYQVHLRMATPNNNSQLTIMIGDQLLSKVDVPITEDYQKWMTHTCTIDLPAGQQTLRISSTGGGNCNLNWLEFANLPVPSYTAIPAMIQAENYSLMNGIRTEACLDDGGGLNVGWIDYMDYLAFNIRVPERGLYSISFRLATESNSNPQFKLFNKDGFPLGTVDVSNTEGWQNWKTFTKVVTLDARDETIYVVSTGGGYWNFNWVDFNYYFDLEEVNKAKPTGEISERNTLLVLPNPTTSSFKLNFDASNDQKITVRVFNGAGGLIERIETEGRKVIEFGQLYKPGTYFVETRKGNKREVKKLIKL